MKINSKNGRNRSFSYESKASISVTPMRKMCLWYPIMKIKEIIIWIRVCPNQQTNNNTKNGRNRSFCYETKASISFIPMRTLCLRCPIKKRKEIIIWIQVYPNWKMNFNSKNGRKGSFSYETKVSISFIPMTRAYLWCPIMKKKEIITWIHIYLNWKINFNSKNGRKRSFCYEYKASISFILMRWMCLWCPIKKKLKLLYESVTAQIDRRLLNLKMVEI